MASKPLPPTIPRDYFYNYDPSAELSLPISINSELGSGQPNALKDDVEPDSKLESKKEQ